MLFLKAFSWDTYLWFMLRDYTVKCNILNGNLYLPENW